MLAGGAEFHIRPALFHQAEVDAGWGQVGEVAAAVDGEVLEGLVAGDHVIVDVRGDGEVLFEKKAT